MHQVVKFAATALCAFTLSIAPNGGLTSDVSAAGLDEYKKCLDECLESYSLCLDFGGTYCDWMYAPPAPDADWEGCLESVFSVCDAGANSCTKGCESKIPKPEPEWPEVPPLGPVDPPQLCEDGSASRTGECFM